MADQNDKLRRLRSFLQMRNITHDRLHAYKLAIQEHMANCINLLEDTQNLIAGDYHAITVRTTAKLEAILNMFESQLIGLNTEVEEEINSYHIPPNKP